MIVLEVFEGFHVASLALQSVRYHGFLFRSEQISKPSRLTIYSWNRLLVSYLYPAVGSYSYCIFKVTICIEHRSVQTRFGSTSIADKLHFYK